MIRLSLAIVALSLASFGADNAAEIVRRSLDRDNRNWERAKDYTFQQKSVQRQLDGKGNVKSTESTTTDITILYGRPFSRLIEKNGKPLSAKEQAKEEERFEKELAKRRRETADEVSKERQRYEKRREEQRRFAREIPEAFDFIQLADDAVDGHVVYVIAAEPKPGHKPRDFRTKFLTKVHGKLWIDKQEFQWVKVEAEALDTISIGLFLARISPGTTLAFAQRRINEELWLPASARIKFDGRLALFKKLRGEVQVEYLNYRKFSTDTKITTIE